MSNNRKNKRFDLEERTAKFGEEVIEFSKQKNVNPIFAPLFIQLVRAATSIGANYCEADCAETKKDFEHKIALSKKESKETKHWLRMIVKAMPDLGSEARALWREANELNLIFTAIINKSRANLKNRN